MAGIINIFTASTGYPSTTEEAAQYWFHYNSKFFDAHPAYTRIASYYGIGGTGFDTPTGTNPSGDNRWGVWRNASAQDPYDVLISAASTNPSNANPSGSLCFLSNIQFLGIGISVAWHSSTVAWNGTTGNIGNDRFTTTPWKSGSVIFPSYNSANGPASGSKNVLQTFADGGLWFNETANIGLIADNDNFTMLTKLELTDVSTLTRFISFERYTPLTNSIDLPYIMLPSYTANGDLMGTFETLQAGGGISVKKNNGINLNLSSSQGFFISNNKLIMDPTYGETGSDSLVDLAFNEYPIICYIGPPKMQLAGRLEWSRVTSKRFQAGDVFVTGTRMVIKNTLAQNPAFTIPWDYSTMGLFSQSFGTYYTSASFYKSKNNFNLLYTSSLYPTRSINNTPVSYVYRGVYSGSFVYGSTNPPVFGATDIVTIRRII